MSTQPQEHIREAHEVTFRDDSKIVKSLERSKIGSNMFVSNEFWFPVEFELMHKFLILCRLHSPVGLVKALQQFSDGFQQKSLVNIATNSFSKQH